MTTASHEQGVHLENSKLLSSAWYSEIPERIAFVDVETTGLKDDDRVVSFAGILLKTPQLSENVFDLSFVHIICDPGKKSHPDAERVQGYSDWLLRHQEPFSENALVVAELLKDADLIVAHNAEFDVSFINRELLASGLPELNRPIFCTMQACRQKGFSKIGLNAVATQMGLARSQINHSALEDAWLAMLIYIWLYAKHTVGFALSKFGNLQPKNLVSVPPMPDEPLPRRKKVSHLKKKIVPPLDLGLFKNNPLEGAWALFERKEYERALKLALSAIYDDEIQANKPPDTLPYEIACMVLRRKTRLVEERDLLLRLFRRIYGSDVAYDQIIACAVPPWGSSATARIVSDSANKTPDLNVTDCFRRQPAIWEMAARFTRVIERLENRTV